MTEQEEIELKYVGHTVRVVMNSSGAAREGGTEALKQGDTFVVARLNHFPVGGYAVYTHWSQGLWLDGVELVSDVVATETDEDICRRTCPDILWGHHPGCPYMKGKA